MAEVVTGAASAARAGCRCMLYGPAAEIRAALDADAPRAAAQDDPATGIEVVDAPVSISNREEPARAVRSKPDASIVQAAKAVADGEADALVTAGATGAALAAALVHIKRLRAVYRPAVAAVLPVPSGRVVFLDVGANVEVRPEHLEQFAHMGAAFSERVLGVSRPRVGLLSVGEEPEKGTADVVEAHRRLASGEHDFEFVGNIEGTDLPAGNVDVVVTDGFTGNVALKLMEGTSKELVAAVRDAARSGVLSTIGGLLLRPKLAGLRERLDPEAVGGAHLLGLRNVVVICHGSSTSAAVASAVGLAERGVAERVTEQIAETLAGASVGRGKANPEAAAERDASSFDVDTVRARS